MGAVPEESTELPAGMLTVMFTDIEGSARHWEHAPNVMARALAEHDQLLRATVEEHGGRIFSHTGDGIGAVFTSPDRAALASVAMQRGLQAHPWPGTRLKVRIGMHMGDVSPVSNNYFGATVNRAARVMDVANGDQITVSQAVAQFVTSVQRRPMGTHQLKGIGTEVIDVLAADELINDPRPLRSRVTTAVKPLPPRAHVLVGRDDDIRTLGGLFQHHSAVALVGPGGVGKTDLALEVARSLEQGLTDGAVLCELSPVDDGAAVLDAVAAALGARAQPEMSLLQSIVDFLEDRELLIVIDNCEHVISDVRELGDRLAPLPGIRLLTTSRERTGIRSEQVFMLRPLDPATSGVELFLERARERDLSFEPNAESLLAIRSICERLAGIPLGIELAAAWVRVLSPEQLLSHLEARLDMLDRNSDAQHRQTLRETMQWSYDLLDAPHARLFERLSVFRGGFSLDAAVEVCAGDDLDTPAVLEVLMALVDKSMVFSERGSGQIRFSMLEPLRQFGRDRLDDAAAAASGDGLRFAGVHAAFFANLVSDQSTKLISPKEAEVWDLLGREWANIRAAFETLLDEGNYEAATTMVIELGWFATLSLRSEVFVWAQQLLTFDGVEERAGRASLLGLRAIQQYLTIDSSSVDTAMQGLALDGGDPAGFCHLAVTSESLNNALNAEDSNARTMSWMDSLNDFTPIGPRLWALGMRVFHLCSHDPSSEGPRLHAEMMEMAEQADSASAWALTRWAGGMVASFESPEAGLNQWRMGLDSTQSLSDVHLLHHLIVGLELHFTASRGDLESVAQRCLETVHQAHDQHYLAGTSHLFGVAAIILARLGEAETGAYLLGSMISHGHVPRRNASRAIEKALGEEAEAATIRGAHLSTNEAAAVAMDTLSSALPQT